MSGLAEWDSFYVIVGSAAGALIGLQFVVMTLIAEKPIPRAEEAGPAFATPTIVHFSTVLLLSAVLRAPWQSITLVAALWGLVALAEWCTASSWVGACESKPHIDRSSKTGCSTVCCLWRRTQC